MPVNGSPPYPGVYCCVSQTMRVPDSQSPIRSEILKASSQLPVNSGAASVNTGCTEPRVSCLFDSVLSQNDSIDPEREWFVSATLRTRTTRVSHRYSSERRDTDLHDRGCTTRLVGFLQDLILTCTLHTRENRITSVRILRRLRVDGTPKERVSEGGEVVGVIQNVFGRLRIT